MRTLLPTLLISLLSVSAHASQCRAASPAATDAWCDAVACADVYVAAGFCRLDDGAADASAADAVTIQPIEEPTVENDAAPAAAPAPDTDSSTCVSALAHISDAWCQAVACAPVYTEAGYCSIAGEEPSVDEPSVDESSVDESSVDESSVEAPSVDESPLIPSGDGAYGFWDPSPDCDSDEVYYQLHTMPCQPGNSGWFCWNANPDFAQQSSTELFGNMAACVDVCELAQHADDLECQESCTIDDAPYTLSDDDQTHCDAGKFLGMAGRGMPVCQPCD